MAISYIATPSLINILNFAIVLIDVFLLLGISDALVLHQRLV